MGLGAGERAYLGPEKIGVGKDEVMWSGNMAREYMVDCHLIEDWLINDAPLEARHS